MLDRTDSHSLRPEMARREIVRARRIRDSLRDPVDEKALQDYIDELEAYLDRSGWA